MTSILEHVWSHLKVIKKGIVIVNIFENFCFSAKTRACLKTLKKQFIYNAKVKRLTFYLQLKLQYSHDVKTEHLNTGIFQILNFLGCGNQMFFQNLNYYMNTVLTTSHI